MKRGPKPSDPFVRFEKYTMPEPNSGCLLWMGHLQNGGYGQFYFDGKKRLAHRFAWESKHGPIPVGLEPDHLCRVRCCVNDYHLELVTRSENTLRGAISALRITTHCRHGHLRTKENTIVEKTGVPHCKVCRKIRYDELRNPA